MSIGRARRRTLRLVVRLHYAIPLGNLWYPQMTNRITAVPTGINMLVCMLLMFTVTNVFAWRGMASSGLHSTASVS